MRSASLALFVFIIPASHAFLAYKSRLCDHSIIPDQKISSRFNQLSSTVIANTKIHHDDVTNVNVDNGIVARAPSSSHQLKRINSSSTLQNFFLATTTAASILFLAGAPTPASAVSGGGLDYAGLDITGRDFSNGDYKGKDFTQVCLHMCVSSANTFSSSCWLWRIHVCTSIKTLINHFSRQTIAKGANFAKSNLQGCRFYKAYLVCSKKSFSFIIATLFRLIIITSPFPSHDDFLQQYCYEG